jgi:hypothetical protein
MRLKSNGQAITKTTLGAVADDAQKPGAARAKGESERSNCQERWVSDGDSVGHELEPPSHQGIGQR